jgi:hypothetical protein
MPLWTAFIRPLWKILRRWLRQVSKYLALAVLIGIPIVAIWGALNPWPPAQVTFASLPEKTPILVAVKFQYAQIADRKNRTQSRSYLLFPATITWPRVVTISQTDAEPPQASDPSLAGFWGLLGTIAFAAFVVWRTWFRRVPANAA